MVFFGGEEYVIKEPNNEIISYYNGVNYLEPIVEENSQEVMMAMQGMETEQNVTEKLLNKKT